MVEVQGILAKHAYFIDQLNWLNTGSKMSLRVHMR